MKYLICLILIIVIIVESRTIEVDESLESVPTWANGIVQGIKDMKEEMNNINSKLSSLENKMLSVENKLIKDMKDMEIRLMNNINSKVSSLENKLINHIKVETSSVENKMLSVENKLINHIDDKIKILLENIHDDASRKIHALSNGSTASDICGNAITAHFVLYDDKIFGISVAHMECYTPDLPPMFVYPCPSLDVTIWKGCPPAGIRLLNITDRVAKAKLGDSASAFGYSGGEHRAWQGYISKYFGKNESGRHFTKFAFRHADELLFSAASQNYGISGGGVINRKGYLGVVRAVDTDTLRNNMAIVTPFDLFSGCVKDVASELEDFRDNTCEHEYDVMPVPSLLIM